MRVSALWEGERHEVKQSFVGAGAIGIFPIYTCSYIVYIHSYAHM